MRSVIAVIVVGLALGVPAAWAAEHTADSPEAIRKAVADGKAVLIDVREQIEWDDGHLKDAKLLPLSKLREGVSADELAKLMPEGKVVYLHCAAGVRCLKAADLLAKSGRDVRAMKPGYDALLKAGFEKAK